MRKNLFKIIVLVVVVLLNIPSIFGQFSIEKWRPYSYEKRKKFFKEALKNGDFKDNIFEITKTPDKWKDESVVILAKKQWYTGYVNNWNNMAYYTYKARVRFKLQDLSAVESFSTYYFENNEIIEITIEKPDGTRNKVKEKDAISVEEEATLPYFGKISVSNSKKIAFENLEPGDIIDVTTIYKDKFLKNPLHWTDPITFIPWWIITPSKVFLSAMYNFTTPYSTGDIIPLNDKFPIVEQKIDFDLGKHFYLNFRSINGAPELEEKDKISRKRKHWVFHDIMRDKQKDEVWSYPLASYPAIKYEVHFMNKRTRRKTDKLIDKRNRVKTSITDADIKKIAYHFIKDSKTNTGNIYYNFYKKEGKKISDDREFIDAFYNYYRTNKLYELTRYTDKPAYSVSVDNDDFVSYMIKILKKRMIRYKLIMGVPREIGGLEGLINKRDIIWGVRVMYGNDDVIYTDCDLYAAPGDVNPIFEGLELYEVTPSWWKNSIKIDETEIPVSSPTKNQFNYTITAEFQDDLDTLKVTRETHLTGMARYRYKYETFPYNKYYEKLKDRLSYEYNFIQPVVYEKSLLRDDDFLAEEDERLTNSMLNRRHYFVKKNAKNDLKKQYVVVDYEKLEVQKDGLEVEDPDMVFTEEYRLRDLLDEAGDGNYILKIGEFIDGQIEIKDIDERERETDIIFPYARSYVYNIKVKIPALMQVVGIETLNRNVTTDVGSFKSSANLNNSILTVKVEKSYRGIYHNKDKWRDILKFVDEAVDFRSANLVLKRQ